MMLLLCDAAMQTLAGDWAWPAAVSWWFCTLAKAVGYDVFVWVNKEIISCRLGAVVLAAAASGRQLQQVEVAKQFR